MLFFSPDFSPLSEFFFFHQMCQNAKIGKINMSVTIVKMKLTYSNSSTWLPEYSLYDTPSFSCVFKISKFRQICLVIFKLPFWSKISPEKSTSRRRGSCFCFEECRKKKIREPRFRVHLHCNWSSTYRYRWIQCHDVNINMHQPRFIGNSNQVLTSLAQSDCCWRCW